MNAIEEALLDFGVRPKLLGFKFLSQGIGLALEDESYLYNTTTKLYRKVAMLSETTPSRVERGMRHAIEAAFLHSDQETVKKYFGDTIDPLKGKATNSEFVAAMALALKEDNTECQ